MTTKRIRNALNASGAIEIADDGTISLTDKTNSTKKAAFDMSGISANNTRTITLPDSNLTVVGTSVAQAITNKDIDGGTASNSNRLTLPFNTTANISGLTRKAGTIIHDTTKTYPVIDDGSALHDLITNDNTQTLQNKSLADATDATKKVTFDCSGITTSTTRNLKVQDRDGILADIQNVMDNSVDKASYYFKADSDVITLPSNPYGSSYSDPFTVIQTVKSNNTSGANSKRLLVLGAPGIENVFDTTKKISVGFDGVAVASLQTIGKNWVTYAQKYDKTNLSLYLNGVLENYTAKSSGSMGTETHKYIGNNASLTRSADGQISRTILFNYALDDSKIKRYSSGSKLDTEDIGGSMAAMLTGDDSTFANQGNWQYLRTIGTQIQITSGAAVFLNALASDPDGIFITNKLTLGKRYRLSFYVTAYTQGGVGLYSTQASNITLTKAGVSYTATNGTTAADAVNPWVFEFTATSTQLGIFAINSTNSSLTIDSASLIQLGAVLDLEPEGIVKQNLSGTQTDIWVDSSGNGLNGTAIDALPINTSKERIVFTGRAVTTTNSGTWYYESSALCTLTPGIWELNLNIQLPACGATADAIKYMISPSTTPGSGDIGCGGWSVLPVASTVANQPELTAKPVVYTVIISTPLYAHAYREDVAGGITTFTGYAKRIA